MGVLNADWYSYLTEDFKLARKAYKNNDRAVFDCPKCGRATVVRIDHIKSKIVRLGFYECSICRRNISTARQAFKDKYGDKNPFQLESVKTKIKETNLERHGVDCLLKKPEIHAKGIEAARSPEARAKAKATLQQNYGVAHPCALNQALAKKVLKDRAKTLRDLWKSTGVKYCPTCKKDISLKKYGSGALYKSTKCRKCQNKYLSIWRALFFRKYPEKKLMNTIRHFIHRIFKTSTDAHFLEAIDVVGCELSVFKDYIANQFQPNMTWENWGVDTWHLDHIIPLSKFSKTNFKLANFYKNLRPLDAKENLRKSAKLPMVLIYKELPKKPTHKVFNDSEHDIYDLAKEYQESSVIFITEDSKIIQDLKLYFKIELKD